MPAVCKIRESVLQTVRKAVRLTYLCSQDTPDLGEIATALGCDEITPATLAGWAKEDGWEEDRLKAQGEEAALREDARRRRYAAQSSLEALHNQAVRMQRGLRPKTWEAAASVQMRCAETLRVWADQDARANVTNAEEHKTDEAPIAPIPDTWGQMTEEDWQRLAHAALAKTQEATGGSSQQN